MSVMAENEIVSDSLQFKLAITLKHLVSQLTANTQSNIFQISTNAPKHIKGVQSCTVLPLTDL